MVKIILPSSSSIADDGIRFYESGARGGWIRFGTGRRSMNTYRKRRRLYILCIMALAFAPMLYREVTNIVQLSYGPIARYFYHGSEDYGKRFNSFILQMKLFYPLQGVLGDTFHVFIMPVVFPVALSFTMFRLSDVWTCRTSRKAIIRFNNKILVVQSTLVSLVLTLFSSFVLFVIYGDLLRNLSRVILYVLMEFLFFFLFYLCIGQIFQLLYYCFLSYGVAALLTGLFCIATAFLQSPFGNDGYWIPAGIISNLYDIFYEAAYANHYAITPGVIRTLIYWSVSTPIILAALEFFKRRIMLHRNFLAKG